MKRGVPADPPEALVAYELAPGVVLFVYPNEALPPVPELTAAEREVAALLLVGADDARIAVARSTSRRTAENQVASIYRKLGVRSRAELAVRLLAPRDDSPR